MNSALRELIVSKKAIATAVGIVTLVVGRLGLDADTELIDRITALVLGYVAAQGIADVGKGAAIARSTGGSP